jgi:membrane protease YdiL (CAAX protease family)
MIASITKWYAAKWVALTGITPMILIGLVVTLYIHSWYGAQRAAGIPHHGSLPGPVRDMGILWGVLIGEWSTVLLWWFFFRKSNSFSTLFQTRTNTPLRELAVGLIVAALAVSLIAVMGRPPTMNWPKLLCVPLSLTAGFCEEMLFRGFVILMIARAGAGSFAQVFWSALVFGVGHFFLGPWGMAWATFLGASLAAVTLWRGNIWSAVTAHSCIDLFVLLYLARAQAPVAA